jgi:hypothetical protein
VDVLRESAVGEQDVDVAGVGEPDEVLLPDLGAVGQYNPERSLPR